MDNRASNAAENGNITTSVPFLQFYMFLLMCAYTLDPEAVREVDTVFYSGTTFIRSLYLLNKCHTKELKRSKNYILIKMWFQKSF